MTGVIALTAITSDRRARSVAAAAVVMTAKPGITFLVEYKTCASGSVARRRSETTSTCETIAFAATWATARAGAVPLPRFCANIVPTLVPVNWTKYVDRSLPRPAAA